LGLNFTHEKRFEAQKTGVMVHSLSGEGRVVSVYARALNIRYGNGLLVSLIEDSNQMTALSLFVPSFFPSQEVKTEAGAPARFEKGRLWLSGFCIDFAKGTSWKGTLTPGSVQGFSLTRIGIFREALLHQGKRGGLLGLIHPDEEQNPFVRKASQILRRIVQEFPDGSCMKGLSQLVGLGPGLTPSGDDFIAGVLLGEEILSLLTAPRGRTQRRLAATRIVGTPSPRSSPPFSGESRRRAMAALATARGRVRRAVIPVRVNKRELWHGLTRTNDGGRTLLFQTLQGYFPSYLIGVVKKLGKAQRAKEMADAVGLAVSHGETSGTDALVGLLFYLNVSASH